MNKSTIASNAALGVVKKSDENQRANKSDTNTVVSRFFDQKTDIPSLRPLSMSNKNKRDYTIAKLYRASMICSEDVSRIKRAKIDVATKSTTNPVFSLDNVENDGDFLEKLKKNFDKNLLKQSILDNHPHRTKLSSKRKALFNEESLKLINNFKEYIKEKDDISSENINMEIPMQNNAIIPFKDTKNDQYQGIIYHNNEITQSNVSNIRSQLNFPKRNLIEIRAAPEISKELSDCSNQLVNSRGETSQSFELRHNMMGMRSISEMQIPDPLNFVTTVMNPTDNNDLPIRYPTPPLIYDSHFQIN